MILYVLQGLLASVAHVDMTNRTGLSTGVRVRLGFREGSFGPSPGSLPLAESLTAGSPENESEPKLGSSPLLGEPAVHAPIFLIQAISPAADGSIPEPGNLGNLGGVRYQLEIAEASCCFVVCIFSWIFQ